MEIKIISANLQHWTSHVNNLAHCLKHLRNNNLNKSHREFSFCSHFSAIMLNRPPNWDRTMLSTPTNFLFSIVWDETCSVLQNEPLAVLRKQAKTRWPQRWVDRVWMKDIFPQSPGVWADSDELELAAVINASDWNKWQRLGEAVFICVHMVSGPEPVTVCQNPSCWLSEARELGWINTA